MDLITDKLVRLTCFKSQEKFHMFSNVGLVINNPGIDLLDAIKVMNHLVEECEAEGGWEIIWDVLELTPYDRAMMESGKNPHALATFISFDEEVSF